MADTTTNLVRSYEGIDIPAPGVFELDPSHTQIGFVARHLMVTKVRGRFTDFHGTATIADDPLQSTLEVEVQPASVDTRDPKRDEHLRSADFFEVERFPSLTFRSTKITKTGKTQFALEGNLTVRDVTKPVVLEFDYEGVVQDPWGGQRFGITASADLDREEFGLMWNVALETGGVLVGKAVKLELEAELVRKA